MDSSLSVQSDSDCDFDEKFPVGKENVAGRAIFKGSEMLCPVSTTSALAIAEQPELRAYKLGKQKCSYNQVELVIKDLTGGKMTELKVSEAIETFVGQEVDEKLRESCLKFNVRFVNDNRMNLYIYVVYATPHEAQKSDRHTLKYQWIPVTRSKCRKGCKGPIIRGLQRFGRMPRRGLALEGEDSWKEPRHLYIAIDEASTHVCPRHETSKFRLLVAAYDRNNHLLGTTVSSSIRVLANNDAPLGAASFKLHCHIMGSQADGVADCPLRNHNVGGSIAGDRATISRSPLHDIHRNTRDPRAHKSTVLAQNDTTKTFEICKSPFGNVAEEGVEPRQLAIKGVGFDFAEGSTVRRAEAAEELVYSKTEKDHSLTDLCHRLFKTCVLKRNHGLRQSTVTLRGLASALGARRRLILEILSVLESIQVVRQQSKERYRWHGTQKIGEFLMKIKESFCYNAPDSEPPDPKSAYHSPGRRGTGVQSSPMAALSKRFIQLFLVREAGFSITWDQILESIVTGHGHDPETARAKTRRLEEIARIFSALHLIKKTVDQRLQSGLFYEWLGPDGVQSYLSNIHVDAESHSGIDGKKCRTRMVVSTPEMAQQSVITIPENQSSHGTGHIEQIGFDDDIRFCDSMAVCSTERGVAAQAQELSVSQEKHFEGHERVQRQTCQPLQLLPQSPSQWKNSSEHEEIQSLHSHIPVELQQRQDLLPHGGCKFDGKANSHEGQDLDSSISECSERSHPERPLPHDEEADEEWTTTEEFESEDGVAYRKSLDAPGKEQDRLSVIVNELNPQERDFWALESSDRRDCDSTDCHEQVTTPESEVEMDQSSARIKQSASPYNHGPRFTYNSSHDFPYKKRKFDITSFGRVGELHHEENHPGDTETLPSPSNQAEGHCEDHLQSAFDPFSKLLIICSPQQIMEFQLQNPDFLTNYVMMAREIHHQNSAQHARQRGLIRPEAKIGKVPVRTINSAFSSISSSVSGRCR